MKKVAILGAMGHIGKSLIHQFSLKNEFEVSLFSRSKDSIDSFLYTFISPEAVHLFHTDTNENFIARTYDAVINCTGIGNPAIFKNDPRQIFEVTEKFDELVISNLKQNPDTLYINLSSGAVYGKGIESGALSDTQSLIDINDLKPSDYYGIAKINSEAKHRALSNFNIVDLRIFSFFSRFIDLESTFLIADIIKSIKNKQTFLTNSDNIVRDFTCPSDLYDLIKLLIDKKQINDVFDVYSIKPILKFELLDFFKEKYGLHYQINETSNNQSPTGNKNNYYSKFDKASKIGFMPKFSSLTGIEVEMKYIELAK